MTERDLQRVYICPKHSRDSKIISDKEFVNIDNGSMGGTHWVCFYVKDKKSIFFDSFVGQRDKCLVNQLPKPIIYHTYKIQDINIRLCGSYCLFFFYLIKTKNIMIPF